MVGSSSRDNAATVVAVTTVKPKKHMKTHNTAKSAAPVPMTVRAAARIYSATAAQNNGTVPQGSFAARAMSAGMTNANASGSKRR